MRRTGSVLRQQHDTCSCWACRDRKYREARKTGKQKALQDELNMGSNDINIIFELDMIVTYPRSIREIERNFQLS